MRLPCLSVVSLLAFAGCYTYAPVEVHVVDAETRRPIAGVRLNADYPRFLEFFPPKLDSAVTDAGGVARLDVCTNHSEDGRAFLTFHGEGSDYLLANPSAKGVVELPVAPLRARAGGTCRLDVELLSMAAWRHRYHAESSEGPR